MKFLEDAKLVDFKEDTHQYFFQGKELMPVTHFIEFFSWPFDESGEILARCAAKEGMSQKKLKKIWESKGDKAAKLGNLWHASIEHYIRTGKIRNNKFTDLVTKFTNQYSFKGQIFPEVRVYCPEVGICGTSDVVEIIDNKILNIKDWKSNKKIDDWSYRRKMKYPVEYRNDSKLQKYSIQINIYSYLLCSKYGFTPGDDNCIFWIDQKKREITKIPVEINFHDIINMIGHYTYMKSLTPEQLAELNKPKILTPEEEWID